MRSFFLLASLSVLAAQGARACETSQPVEVWACLELAFTATGTYGHPIRDVPLRVAFSHSSGDTISVGGFWDGGHTWRARVAFPRAGSWMWATRSPDAGLGGRSGQAAVVEATGADPYRTRGWPRVSADNRYLTYDDGTPFFYLADTAWEAGWAASLADFETYLADRLAKGFNVVQIIVSTHQYNYPEVITNQAGQPYILGTDRSRLNPRYFDKLDAHVRRANESGMAVALVPLWATYSAAHDADSNYEPLVTLDQALLLAGYIGARYAGANLVWIVGGDQYYHTEERRTYWDAFARRLRAASGSRHLMTVHPSGYVGSFTFWPVAPDWLDFHMYQGSHYDAPWYVDEGGTRAEDTFGALRADGGYAWQGALQGYHLAEPRPVLNAEANYEDLFGRFWALTDTSNGHRISAADVREAAYWGLLSGSTVGYAYGANGVWQWTTEVRPVYLYPRRTAMDALSFPGAGQMRRLRELAEANDWTRWVPRPDLASELDSPQFIPAALGPDRLVAYLPEGTETFGLDVPPSYGASPSLTWFSTTSDTAVLETVDGSGYVELTPPDGQDWFLVVLSGPVGNAPLPPGSMSLRLLHGGPNPARSWPTVTVRATDGGRARLDVFDALGRQVYTAALPLAAGDVTVRLPLRAPGSYFVRLTASGTDGEHEDRLQITVAR